MLGTLVMVAMATVIKVAVHVIVGGNKMGFRKPMDYNAVYHQIYMTGVEILNSRNDGFTQWEMKKDLYQIQSMINLILAQSGKFSGEDEWLAEQEKNKIMRILER